MEIVDKCIFYSGVAGDSINPTSQRTPGLQNGLQRHGLQDFMKKAFRN